MRFLTNREVARFSYRTIEADRCLTVEDGLQAAPHTALERNQDVAALLSSWAQVDLCLPHLFQRRSAW
jgi:hypothetical protein